MTAPSSTSSSPRLPPRTGPPNSYTLTRFAPAVIRLQPAHAPSAHVQAAVQREIGARGEARFIGSEPSDDRRDFVRRAEAAHRNRRNDLLEHIGADRLDHVRAD